MTKREKSAAYTGVYYKTTHWIEWIDSKFQCGVWESTAGCDVHLVPSHSDIFSHGYLLQCLMARLGFIHNITESCYLIFLICHFLEQRSNKLNKIVPPYILIRETKFLFL